MLLALRWLLCTLVGSSLVVAGRRRHFGRLPGFFVYSLVALLALVTHIQLENWTGRSWLDWNAVLTGLRVLVTLECVWRAASRAWRGDRWAVVGFGAAAAIGTGVLAWSVDPVTIYRLVASVSAQVSLLLLIFMAGSLGLCWRYEMLLPRFYGWHALLWGGLLANHVWTNTVHPLTMRAWRVDHATYLAVAGLSYAGWIWLFASADAFASKGAGKTRRWLPPRH